MYACDLLHTSQQQCPNLGIKFPLMDNSIYLHLKQTHLDNLDLTLVHEVFWICSDLKSKNIVPEYTKLFLINCLHTLLDWAEVITSPSQTVKDKMTNPK